MPLPVLSIQRSTDADLLRLFHRTDRFWSEHLGETTQLECGVAVIAPDLPQVWEANRMLEAALAPGAAPADAVAEAEAHFAAAGVPCWQWQLYPSTSAGTSNALAEHLMAVGYTKTSDNVMALASPPHACDLPALPGVTVLPARAAFRHARELAEESAARWNEPQVAEAQMRHLDDPHCDALLALRDGRAVGRVTVLAVGDIGRVEQVYVAQHARRQGIGRLLLARALEICARSLFRHVLLSVTADNSPAVSLYTQFGFRGVGRREIWSRVGSRSATTNSPPPSAKT
jgi:ribosomal protein S18 acetylase RimI-like enzyme